MMFSESKNDLSYSKKITVISILSFLFSFGCVLLGYFFVPLAAAAYAVLLCTEKDKKILAFVIPLLVFALGIFFNGLLSPEPIIYLCLGLILYFTKKCGKSKNETIFWLMLSSTIFIVLSFLILGLTSTESLSFSSIKLFYLDVYESFKRSFIEIVTGLTQESDTGILYFVFNRETAEAMFHSLILYAPAFILICAFILTGVSLMLFDFFTVRLNPMNEFIKREFIPTKFLAYTYIVFALFSVLSSSATDVFSLTLRNVYTVLLVIFAYFGAKMVYATIKQNRGGAFAALLLVVGIAMLTTTALSLLSYIGVFFSITLNGADENKKTLK